MTLPVGTTIDKYTLGACIGQGGMGAVYEAHHTLVGKHCAIKLLHPEFASQQDVITRMLREAQAAAAIGHPNIVDTMDFGSTPDGSYYLVMEYLDGESLGGLIKRNGALPTEPTVRIATQVLSALEAAHAKGIVHRDLKPDNIFIARGRRGDEEVKLLDFGISKFSGNQEDAMRLTASGMVLGTPYYMSPEQADGAANVDHRTDLWAMGVILYEALSGKIPFPGTTYSQVIIQVVTREAEPLRVTRPDVSMTMEAVVLKALAKDPTQRWSSATEMRQALQGACPELQGATTRLSQTGPAFGAPTDAPDSLLATGPAKHAVVGDAGQTTDPNFVTSETAISGMTPGPLPTPEPAVAQDQPPLYSQSQSQPQVASQSQLTSPAAGAVAGRESAMWDPGARKRRFLIGLGVVAGIAAVGLILLFTLGRNNAPTSGKSASGSGTTADAMGRSTADATARPAPGLTPMRRVAPGSTVTLTVKLEGLPRRAVVKLDGKVTKVPLTLAADGRFHELQISAPRHHVLNQTFKAKPDLTSVTVKMRRRRGRHQAMRPGPRPMRPAPRPMKRDGALADPYRTAPRRRPPRPMRRGGVYTDPYK